MNWHSSAFFVLRKLSLYPTYPYHPKLAMSNPPICCLTMWPVGGKGGDENRCVLWWHVHKWCCSDSCWHMRYHTVLETVPQKHAPVRLTWFRPSCYVVGGVSIQHAHAHTCRPPQHIPPQCSHCLLSNNNNHRSQSSFHDESVLCGCNQLWTIRPISFDKNHSTIMYISPIQKGVLNAPNIFILYLIAKTMQYQPFERLRNFQRRSVNTGTDSGAHEGFVIVWTSGHHRTSRAVHQSVSEMSTVKSVSWSISF